MQEELLRAEAGLPFQARFFKASNFVLLSELATICSQINSSYNFFIMPPTDAGGDLEASSNTAPLTLHEGV